MQNYDRAKVLADNAQALRVAGLAAAANSGQTGNTVTPGAGLGRLAESRDPRLAKAAKNEILRQATVVLDVDPNIALPEHETPPLDEQTPEERAANAVDLTTDVTASWDDSEYA